MKAEIVAYWKVSMIYYYTQEWMNCQNNKSKNLILTNIFECPFLKNYCIYIFQILFA